MFLKYNPMSQIKSKVQACVLIRKIVKATKRKYAMLCCVCLFAESSKTPLPRLMAWSWLWTFSTIIAIIIIIIIIIIVIITGILATVQLSNYSVNSNLWKGVARDICIVANRVLPSKSIRAVGIDRPRQMGRINKSTDSRALLTQMFHLNVTNVQECRWWLIKENERSKNTDWNSERRH